MPQHLLQISDLTRTQIETFITRAQTFDAEKKALKLMANTHQQPPIAALLFYENSTRTRISFELAASALGMKTVNVDINTSSVKKDESLLDTIQTLGAMGCQYIIIRHSESGIVAKMADTLGHQLHFINAGDGHHAHPTQGLLDMLTITQYKPSFHHLRVGILGDSVHSRVAKSDIAALQCLGCQDIRLIGPKAWLLAPMTGVSCHTEDTALADLDVIITLRVQKERITHLTDELLADYIQHYQLNPQRLMLAHPDAIVMHPGPINRGIEIASSVADGSQSVILKQIHNGVLMRMAVLEAMQ